MDDLPELVSAFFQQLQPLLSPVREEDARKDLWQLTTGQHRERQLVPDKKRRFGMAMVKPFTELQKLATYCDLSNRLGQLAWVQRGQKFFMHQMRPGQVVMTLLLDSIDFDCSGTPSLDSSRFLCRLGELEKLCLGDSVQVTMHSQVAGPVLAIGDTFKLCDGTTIWRADDSRMNEWVRFDNRLEFFDSSTFITQTQTLPLDDSNPPPPHGDPIHFAADDCLYNRMEEVLDVLRIQFYAVIGHRMSIYFSDLRSSGSTGFIVSGSSYKSGLNLQDSMIPEIDSCLKALRSNADAKIRTSIRRVKLAMDREDIEDALVDLVIALESIFVPEKSSDTSFRFRLNGSAVLCAAGCESDVAQAYRKMHLAYDLRSSIVHGSENHEAKLRNRMEAIGAPYLPQFVQMLHHYIWPIYRWLWSMPASDRPYDKTRSLGWERLSWSMAPFVAR